MPFAFHVLFKSEKTFPESPSRACLRGLNSQDSPTCLNRSVVRTNRISVMPQGQPEMTLSPWTPGQVWGQFWLLLEGTVLASSGWRPGMLLSPPQQTVIQPQMLMIPRLRNSYRQIRILPPGAEKRALFANARSLRGCAGVADPLRARSSHTPLTKLVSRAAQKGRLRAAAHPHSESHAIL